MGAAAQRTPSTPQQLRADADTSPARTARPGFRYPGAAGNVPVIKDGQMRVSTLPGLGLDFDQEYLKAMRADGEPWWGEE